MLVKAEFPVNERVSSGTSYKEMLAEFGAVGALLAGYLVFKQLGMVFGADADNNLKLQKQFLELLRVFLSMALPLQAPQGTTPTVSPSGAPSLFSFALS